MKVYVHRRIEKEDFGSPVYLVGGNYTIYIGSWTFEGYPDDVGVVFIPLDESTEQQEIGEQGITASFFREMVKRGVIKIIEE